MNIKIENKYNFFILEVYLTETDLLVNVMDQLDIFLGKTLLKEQPLIFLAKNKTKIIYFFRSGIRKRKGSLLKILESEVEVCQQNDYRLLAYSYSVYQESREQILKSNKYDKINVNNIKRNVYTRKDISMLDNRKNWYPWEIEMYDMIFDYNEKTFPKCKIKEAPFRKIHLIYDTVGISGKSTFAKWLSDVTEEGDVFELAHATASQLKARICRHYHQNGGAGKLYIIDLPRARSRFDSDSDLILSLEYLKNGSVIDAMYGSSNSVKFDPPWIIIFTNVVPEPKLMSIDRWKILKMDKKNLKLKEMPIQSLIRRDALKK